MKVKGKFEANDRGNQIMAFEVEVIELNEADARPSHLELKVASSDFDQSKSLRLNRILKSYPGRDGVVLLVQQSDGRKFRAELPVSVDSRSPSCFRDPGSVCSQVWRLLDAPSFCETELLDAAKRWGALSRGDADGSRTYRRIAHCPVAQTVLASLRNSLGGCRPAPPFMRFSQ